MNDKPGIVWEDAFVNGTYIGKVRAVMVAGSDMGNSPEFCAFTKQEHRSRLHAARQIMNESDLDACVCRSSELFCYFAA